MNKPVFPIFSGLSLKIISTLLFIVGRILLELDFANAGIRYKVGNVMVCAALPIAFFLAIEGYRHTQKVSKFLLRLAIAGAIGELIIDYSLFGKSISKYFSGNNLNILLTLTIGLLMVYCLDLIRHHFTERPIWRNMLTIAVILIFVALGTLVRAEFYGVCIFSMAAMYLFYNNRYLVLFALAAIQIAILGSAALVIMYAPIIGLLLTWFYNGKRGYMSLASRGFFYFIYPLSYSILALIVKAGL